MMDNRDWNVFIQDVRVKGALVMTQTMERRRRLEEGRGEDQ